MTNINAFELIIFMNGCVNFYSQKVMYIYFNIKYIHTYNINNVICSENQETSTNIYILFKCMSNTLQNNKCHISKKKNACLPN